MECSRCGACCTQFWVCLTPFDIIRISEATGKKPYKFVDLVEDTVGNRERKEPMVKINGKKSLLILATEKNNVCIFYKKGCKIYENRPFLCRTYPFKLKKGKLVSTESRVCLDDWFPEEKEGYERDCVEYDKQVKLYKKIAKKWKDGSLQEFLELSRLFL